MKTADYCAAVKRRLGISSNYALAKALGESQQRISHYANGRRVFDNTMAARVAQILELDLAHVIADLELERQPRGKHRALWEKLRDAAVLAALTIGAALTFALVVAPTRGQAAILQNSFYQHDGGALSAMRQEYTLCRLRSRGGALSWVLAFLAAFLFSALGRTK